jgi:hypothetical protein
MAPEVSPRQALILRGRLHSCQSEETAMMVVAAPLAYSVEMFLQ